MLLKNAYMDFEKLNIHKNLAEGYRMRNILQLWHKFYFHRNPILLRCHMIMFFEALIKMCCIRKCSSSIISDIEAVVSSRRAAALFIQKV